MVVEQTTPKDGQLRWTHKRLPTDSTPLATSRPAAEPANVGRMKVVRLRFASATDDIVPVLLATPAEGKPPFRLVIALHAIYCDKAQVLGQFGPALTEAGYAVMSPDLPCHGERAGNVLDLLNPRKAAEAKTIQRRAVVDVRQCIDLAEQMSGTLDLKDGVEVVGFSLGAWVACFTAGCDDRISATTLCLAGAPPLQTAALAPQFGHFDTAASLANFHGRVMLLNAEHDALIPRPWTERLFEAANEPKQLKWYDSGHNNLPKAAIDECVRFLSEDGRRAQP